MMRMSNCPIDVWSDLAPAAEEYSIDEAFLQLDSLPNPAEHGCHIRQTVRQWTGIPVSIGIGPTKVLAKIANRVAKKQPQYGGVFAMPASPDECLAAVPVAEIWGIGPSYATMLINHGINYALDLKQAPDSFIRQHMTVVGLRVVQELRGISCLALEEIEPQRKSICCSRSFGRPVLILPELREAVSSYIARVAEKLRRRGLVASYLSVSICTNQFNAGAKYSAGRGAMISPGSNHTMTLNETAQRLLVRCYQEGFCYAKAGVLLEGLTDENQIQQDLFSAADTPRQKALMQVLDAINARYGRDTLHLAGEGLQPRWKMRREKLSSRFTTCWEELRNVSTRMRHTA